MQTRPLRIGTRGSALALAQAAETRARLMAAHALPEEAFAIEVISTSGDRIQDRPLSEVGGKGLFTKEIEEALLDGRIDVAVHSAKDMATVLPDGLAIAAFLPREDVRDVFIGRTARRIEDLAEGARVGTASLRRQAMLKRERPDLDLVILRGNVQTRLAKLRAGEVEGTLLAFAGLKRMAMEDEVHEILPVDRFLPAPGQGAIAVEVRQDDERAFALLAPLSHAPTTAALSAERAFLARLDGSCRTPIAGHARVSGGTLDFSGMILSPDGTERFATRRAGPAEEAAATGASAADALIAEAGPGFLERWAELTGWRES